MMAPRNTRTPRTSPLRPCGCDWDTRVFGHAYCWNTPYGLGGGKHVTCNCLACPCHCHQDTPWQTT